MSTTQVYEQMVASTPADLPARIMQVLEYALKNSPGINVTKQDMIKNVYGKFIEKARLSGTTEERQLRDTIADLQVSGYPIIASSGKAGYRLAQNKAEIEEYVSELESRISQLQSKVFALRRYTYPAVWKMEYQQPEAVTQPMML
jgi:hypothetical protein